MTDNRTTHDDNQLKQAHVEELLAAYREIRPSLLQLEQQAVAMLADSIRQQGIYVTAIEHRVKTEDSLAVKLMQKGGKYKTIDDVTDLVGLRVITVYSDDVDKVAVIAKRLFDIDWHESVDKRKLHQPDSFGYSSLHYICRLKRKEGVATDRRRFEVQMRTSLQHVWSTIEHDTDYKGGVQIPHEYLREFSRLAGLLELADAEFSRLRNVLTDYRRQALAVVKDGKLDDVRLTPETFRSFLELRPFDHLNKRIAAVNQAEVYPVSLVPLVPLFRKLGCNTLGDVQRLVDDSSDDAYQLALQQLALTDLDIMTATVGPKYLCLAYVLRKGGNRDDLKAVYDTLNSPSDANAALADNVLRQAAMLPFMQDNTKQ